MTCKSYTGRANINIYNGDCMEFMKDKPAKSYDLAICDPPYGIEIEQRIYKDDKKWDIKIPSKEYFINLFQISNNQIIWGGNYFLEYLYSTKCFITWDKKITDTHTFSMIEFAWTSFDTCAKTFYMPPPGHRGFYKIDGIRQHPTQKPVALYKWLLTNYAKEGDKILDTHGGSMSIAIACWDLGFDLDIIELDKDYYDKAVERFERHINQKQLF